MPKHDELIEMSRASFNTNCEIIRREYKWDVIPGRAISAMAMVGVALFRLTAARIETGIGHQQRYAPKKKGWWGK